VGWMQLAQDIVETTVLPTKELNDKIKLIVTTKLNKYCHTELQCLGHFP